MTDNTVKVQISASYSELETAFTKARDVVAGACDGMRQELKFVSEQCKVDTKQYESTIEQFANILQNRFKGINGAIEGVKTAWAQLAVAAGAGAFMGKAVTQTVEMTTEAEKLGRAMGISATKASYLAMAIGDSHGTTEEFVNLAKGMDKQLAKNEGSMKAMGLQTRDASGHLKDQQTLTLDALETLRGYKEGTDRNIAATKLFGAGVNVSSEMLALNAEKLAAAKEKADAFGLAVGADDKEAANAFRDAMDDMNDIIDAVMKAIGSALLPVLNDLAEWFTSYGPQAILTIKVAIDIVISVFKGLALTVKVLWEVVSLAFNQMTTMAKGFAAVFVALFRGDFAAAKEAGESMMGSMATNIGAAFKNIHDEAAATGSAITDMWGKTINGPGATKDSGTENGGTHDVDTSKPGKKPKDTSAADARREAAEAKKLLKERYDALMEAYRGEEQAAKDNLGQLLEIQKRELESAVAMYGAKSKEAEKAGNRIAETQRKIAEQQERMDLRAAESHRTMKQAEIDIDEQAAQQAEQNGQITLQQLIAMEIDYENQRYQLTRQGLAEEALANAGRVEDHQQTLLRMEELDAAHQGRVGLIAAQATQQRVAVQKQAEGQIASAFSNSMMGLINRTMTWKQAVLGAFASITQGLVKMLADWAAKQAAHYLVERVMHKTNALAKAAMEKTAAAASIRAAAGIAGANGVASMALAPFPLDLTAPGFGAAMALAANGFGVASASQGYDIPAGVNPLTQLHEQEMVLPKEQANVIRDMAGGQGGPSGDTYHINTLDPRGFFDLLRRNPGALADGIRLAHRDGHFSK